MGKIVIIVLISATLAIAKDEAQPSIIPAIPPSTPITIDSIKNCDIISR